jgi:prolycopene isomerase
MDKYDVIIIGAGVSGLVCGCYLAKEGLKVSIVEQQKKIGGYCTSFRRGKYRFDAGVHYLGGIKKGLLGKILSELNVYHKIKVSQFDPSDKIVMPRHTVYIRTDPKETVEEFMNNFPNERNNINKFFSFVLTDNFIYSYSRLRKLNFKQLLDDYFNDEMLQATICMLLGNIGLPASKISALTALMLFKEFILDPGYYPEGGMQGFAESLADRFKQYGGSILVSQKAQRIITKNRTAKAVILADSEIIADFIVSSADATETFKNILDIKDTPEASIVDRLRVSSSIFALYLGLNIDLKNLFKEPADIWYSSSYEPEGPFASPKENINKDTLPCLMLSLVSLHDNLWQEENLGCITAITTAPYENAEFWNNYRATLSNKMLTIVRKFVPQVANYIDIRLDATPVTFQKYTSNREGAAYGWAPLLEQMDASLVPQETSINNLYLAGHWCTKGIGTGCISGTASLGRNTAKLILEKKGKRFNYPLFFR